MEFKHKNSVTNTTTKCCAIKKDGKQCTYRAKTFGNYCNLHFSIRFNSDKAFQGEVKKHDIRLYNEMMSNSDEEAVRSNIVPPAGSIDLAKTKEMEKKELQKIRENLRVERERIERERIERERIEREAAEAEFNRMENLIQFVLGMHQVEHTPHAHTTHKITRDPEGSIDLKSFATDKENIHRSSVQEETKRVIDKILTHKVPDDQNTLEEIVQLFVEPKNFKWSNDESCLVGMNEITHDYNITEAFGTKYSDVCDRIWMLMKEINKKDKESQINYRFVCEILDGIGKCSNGKMARLINVLRGFDDSFDLSTKSRDAFQFAIANLRKLPIDERKVEAVNLFEEFDIPKDEHEVWLDALLDDE
jgi:hypothetical protein